MIQTKPKDKSSLAAFEEQIYCSPDGCWLWAGPKHSDGYGCYQSKMAHRISFKIYRKIDPGRFPVKHSCKNRHCVNPDHLLLMDVHNQSERFRIIEKYSMPEPNTGCWLWTEFLSFGYGRIRFQKTTYRAHRFSYETFFGEIPEGKYVCHKCDERSCINPDHLFLGTHLNNVQDMVNKKRHVFGERNVNSKCTPISVQIIREAWLKFGRGSQLEIARYFNLHQSNVSSIVNRKTWSSVIK